MQALSIASSSSERLSQSPPLPLTRKTLQEHDRQTSTEVRQFHCRPCLKEWWRVVPSNKPVSRCNDCHIRYDAIPRDGEYGVGRFTCTNIMSNKLCGHVFYRRCDPSDTEVCPQCEAYVSQPHIHPKYTKYCQAYLHISTGSTVETWLSQTAASSRAPSPPIRHPIRLSYRSLSPPVSLPDRPPSPPVSLPDRPPSPPVRLPDRPVLKRQSSFHGSTHSLYGRASSCGSHGSGRSVVSVGSRGFNR